MYVAKGGVVHQLRDFKDITLDEIFISVISIAEIMNMSDSFFLLFE